MFEYILYKSGAAFSRVLPPRIRKFLTVLIADITFTLQRTRRRIVAENLRVVMGSHLPPEKISLVTKSIYRNFAGLISDFLYQPFEKQSVRMNRVEFRGLEKLDHALTRGRGVILVSAHMGNWELGGAILADKGYRVASVVLDHRSRLVTEFFDMRRRRAGIKIIKTGEFREKALSILEKGYILALLADRNISGKGREVLLFGEKVVLPIGPFLLAKRKGTPVLPAFMFKNEDGGYCVEIAEPLVLHDRVESTHNQWASTLETALAAHPSDWMMFDKMFY